MRNVTLFIAMSLDGYIADKDRSVHWLAGQSADMDDMVTYKEFIKDIDSVVMGWNTYYQVKYELSPTEWYYKDLMSYVMTHRQLKGTENIKFINKDICFFIKELKRKGGKGIWICGGASIIQPLIQAQLIDTFHISVIPTILGEGIRLFESYDKELKLKLIKSESYNGIIDLIYELR